MRGQAERSDPSELRFASFEPARMAAGGVIRRIDDVRGGAPAAFVLNRPPGHPAIVRTGGSTI